MLNRNYVDDERGKPFFNLKMRVQIRDLKWYGINYRAIYIRALFFIAFQLSLPSSRDLNFKVNLIILYDDSYEFLY